MFLSYDGLCDPLGGSQILPYLCGLAKTGKYQIHVVSAEKQGANRSAIVKLCEENGISWHPVVFNNKIKGFSAWKNLRNIKRKAVSVLAKFPIKIIHARSLPMAVIARKINNNNLAKIIFDMRGFWANERVEGKIWNLKNPVYALMYKKMLQAEKEMLENANAIVSLTNAGKNHILNVKPQINATNIYVIPCAVDLKLFDAGIKNRQTELKNKYGFNNNFVVTYSGSLGTWYMLDEMISFFAIIKAKIPNAVFNIVSKDSFNASQLELKYELPQGSIRIRQAQRNEMPEILACSDIGLFFIKPTFAKKGSSPTKLAEFLALGVPLISNSGIGDMDEQFTNQRIGFLVGSFSQSEYERAASYILNMPGNNCVEFASSYYDLNKAINSYNTIYSQLTFGC